MPGAPSWPSSILLAVLTGILGLFAAGLIANACVSWYRISGFEGKAGYFVVFTALLGGAVAVIVGLVTARLVAGSTTPGFLRALAIACGITIGVAGSAAILAWWLGDIPPKIDGQELDLAVEIRLPAGEARPEWKADDARFFLQSIVNHRMRKYQVGELRPAEARQEGGRWIVPGSAFLFTMRGLRGISLEHEGKSIAGFIVPLPARPGPAYEQWSEWGPRPPAGEAAWPETKASFRFRVVRITPPPPEPDPEEVEAARFAALAPDASLSEWLSFLSVDAPEERARSIMQIVESRQAELASLILSPDDAAREPAMETVLRLSVIAPEVSTAVISEGNAVAAGIRRFNGMSADDPRFYDVQIELRSRFRYWHRAWWTVHQRTGVDGRPPVQAILELAQVRAKGTSMDEIVINAQAHLDGLSPEKSP